LPAREWGFYRVSAGALRVVTPLRGQSYGKTFAIQISSYFSLVFVCVSGFTVYPCKTLKTGLLRAFRIGF
jgi:hypothetical protein